ncbi:MAG: hypothetical protein QN187_03535 [Armatimonadota bacterium]|nr:hypothetical protein [Armatimonadota bacterium]MDR7518961.1 hypothetical protein [Armatimonadota bacterium]MDR7548568.1 hypothetical protein [Armatimonadota bacterium]
MQHHATVTAALALVAALGTAVGAQPSTMIVPGRAIGPFEIGMPLERAKTLMEQYGTVESVDTPALHGMCNPERGVGICAFDRVQRLGLESAGTVAFIITDDARFTTDAGGLAVGQPLLDFLRTFGLYTSGQGIELRWDGRGLSVEVGPGDRGIAVRIIGVFTPRSVASRPPATH